MFTPTSLDCVYYHNSVSVHYKNSGVTHIFTCDDHRWSRHGSANVWTPRGMQVYLTKRLENLGVPCVVSFWTQINGPTLTNWSDDD